MIYQDQRFLAEGPVVAATKRFAQHKAVRASIWSKSKAFHPGEINTRDLNPERHILPHLTTTPNHFLKLKNTSNSVLVKVFLFLCKCTSNIALLVCY